MKHGVSESLACALSFARAARSSGWPRPPPAANVSAANASTESTTWAAACSGVYLIKCYKKRGEIERGVRGIDSAAGLGAVAAYARLLVEQGHGAGG